MKSKTLKFLVAALLLVATGFTKANAEASWLGNSAINVNGTWYYAGNNLDWCSGAFHNANLGVVHGSISLGAQSQVWETGDVNWNGGSVKFFYKIDDGAAVELSLPWYKFENNNNFFQSGGADFVSENIDISGLSYGDHTIAVWFNCDNQWDSNNSNNYVASFTRLPDGIQIDPDFQPGETGYYYVNAPLGTANANKEELVVDMTAWGYAGPIKMYDDGGKAGNPAAYSAGARSRAVHFKVSDGYVVQVTGTVDLTESCYVYLRDGDSNGSRMGYERYNNSYQANSAPLNDLGTQTTTLSAVYIASYYSPWGSGSGLDLTVTPISKTVDNNIVIGSQSGGSISGPSPSSATVNTVVNFTATPNPGKMLNEVIVVDALGHKIDATGGWYNNNEVSFMMPGSDVTVTPVFVDVADISVNIPHYNFSSAPKQVTVPDGVSTFKVYECGGPDKNYGLWDSGYLLITAPTGCFIEFTGTVTCDDYSWLILYDGNTDSAPRMGAKSSFSGVNGDDIGTILSSGNQALVYFHSQYPDNYYSGVDVTVKIVDPSASHNITIASGTQNGSVSVASNTASVNEQVVVTVSPDDGYLLNSLDIVDEAGNKVESTGGVWYSGNLASATFAMPNSDVTIIPVFALKANGLSVNMPSKSNSYSSPVRLKLPEGISTFKVYDDGGPDGNYASFSYNSFMLITARKGYIVHLTGTVNTKPNSSPYSTFGAFDSSSTSNNLGYFRGENKQVDVKSTQENMLLQFSVGGETHNCSGFEVTVAFELSPTVKISLGSAGNFPGESAKKYYYVATFYNEEQAYKLPDECRAFIVRSDRSLCLIGDGTIVPKDCPVVIISTKRYSSAELTATDEAVTVPAGNALKPAKWDTQVSNVKVLSIRSNNIGFYNYTGTISAGKAYLE